MILQSLVDHYEQLLRDRPQDVAHPGWCQRQVSCMLELSEKGELINVIPSSEKRGWERTVPEQVKRASGIVANLLCDNACYLLGLVKEKEDEDEGERERNIERTQRCFGKAKETHLSFLLEIDSPAATAVRCFFETWDPLEAVDCPEIIAAMDHLRAGGNLVFCVNGREVLDNPEIQEEWNHLYRKPTENAAVMRCLVSGERTAIARLHPVIKGVRGAQSMGASLVSFNARSFESYGHDEEQGLNAPVSEYAAFAYTTALNHLLSDRDHHMTLGDTTIVYWADHADDACSRVYTDFLSLRFRDDSGKASKSDGDTDLLIDAVMSRLVLGLPIEEVDLKANFFVLGIAPSAARLSVRFFYHDTFGAMLGNLKRHYERLDIIRPPYEKKYLAPFRILAETENPNAKQAAATSILGGALMRSILGDQPYPVALYENVLLRVRASRDVNRGKAAIIKAFLIRNKDQNADKEVVTVGLNTERQDGPYILGRLFSRLEDLQYAVNPDLNATIKDKYFNAAGTTPVMVFPLLMRLGEQHASKLKREKPGVAAKFWREIREFNDVFQSYPKNFSPDEQGAFLLGYYHQSQQSYIDRKRAKEEREQKHMQSQSNSQEV